MNPAHTLAETPGPAPSPADPAPEADQAAMRRPVFTKRRLQAIGALAVAVAFVASEETRVLVLLIGFAAAIAALAGPWSLAFWRLVQPSLFVETGETIQGTAPAPPVERRPLTQLAIPDKPKVAA